MDRIWGKELYVFIWLELDSDSDVVSDVSMCEIILIGFLWYYRQFMVEFDLDEMVMKFLSEVFNRSI